jgi:uncharacterized protein
LEDAWTRAPVVWLAGVRRVGKTTLVKGLAGARYLNCDLPSTAERLEDPERFLRSLTEKILILDEVHQLPDPSRLLKIAADEFPKLRVVATGSSTLAATDKFKDSLSGRKRVVHLVPVLASELDAFGVPDLEHRMLRGGLPAALLGEAHDPELYSEWIDSYFARDVQELFSVAKRSGFLALVKTLLKQSGGLAEVTKLSALAGLSRPTTVNYLNAIEVTQVATLLRPYHGGGARELLHQPKIFAFDTGFVAWSRGITELRPEDRGLFWEHLVLETLQATVESRGHALHFWRDKDQREVDFVVVGARGAVHAIECKWSPAGLETKGLRAFRAQHPRGRNFLVVPGQVTKERQFGELRVTLTSLEELVGLVE